MKLATFTHGGATRTGMVDGEFIRDFGNLSYIPSNMIALLERGPRMVEAVHKAAAQAPTIPLSEVRLEAPVMRPRKFLGLGASYDEHAREIGHFTDESRKQIWFNKQVTCVNGPYDAVHRPLETTTMDYEGELAIIIGRRGRRLRGQAAWDLIAGFTICNDFSVREWQRRSPTHTLGKSFDTHGPLGPWLVTPDELNTHGGLSLETWVNGELRQRANTRNLRWSFVEMIEELSTVFTLEPGDVLSTGSPSGVGAAMLPPCFLQPGDVVRVAIEGIGHIENRVMNEPER